MHYVTFELPFLTWAWLACFFLTKKAIFLANVKALSRQKCKCKGMQIQVCTVEGAAQTNLSAVLLFWITEE